MSEAPERIWAAPSLLGGWAEANAGDWPSPGNPNDTPYIREDLHAAEVQRLQERVRDLKEALATNGT